MKNEIQIYYIVNRENLCSTIQEMIMYLACSAESTKRLRDRVYQHEVVTIGFDEIIDLHRILLQQDIQEGISGAGGVWLL